MITSILFDNFKSEIIEEKRPVLLACLNRYLEFEEQVEVLESISKKYGEALKICLLSEDFIRVFSWTYAIKGTPTFLIFDGGKERNRLLGKADSEKLITFILQTLPYLQDDCLTSHA